VRILPFIEQAQAYQQFTTALPGQGLHWGGVHDLSNTTFQATGALRTQLSAMLCPSSSRTTRNTTETVPGGGGFCGDYAVNTGHQQTSVGGTIIYDAPEYQSTGPFPLAPGYSVVNSSLKNSNPGLRFKDITDGVGKTIFIGEKHIPIDQFGRQGFDNTVYATENPGLNSSTRMADQCSSTSLRCRLISALASADLMVYDPEVTLTKTSRSKYHRSLSPQDEVMSGAYRLTANIVKTGTGASTYERRKISHPTKIDNSANESLRQIIAKQSLSSKMKDAFHVNW
jgi:hypothetical protein